MFLIFMLSEELKRQKWHLTLSMNVNSIFSQLDDMLPIGNYILFVSRILFPFLFFFANEALEI